MCIRKDKLFILRRRVYPILLMLYLLCITVKPLYHIINLPVCALSRYEIAMVTADENHMNAEEEKPEILGKHKTKSPLFYPDIVTAHIFSHCLKCKNRSTTVLIHRKGNVKEMFL